MNHSRAICGVLGLMLVAPFTGCGGAFDAKLSGTVTLDGQRLESGKMMFTPKSSEGTTAYAGIDSSGQYRVQTGAEFGLKPGDYTVAVVAREKPTVEPGYQGPPPVGKQITPRWYSKPSTSGINISVKPGSNSQDIELTSTPPDGWGDSQAGRGGRRQS